MPSRARPQARRPKREILHRALTILAALQEDDFPRDDLIDRVTAELGETASGAQETAASFVVGGRFRAIILGSDEETSRRMGEDNRNGKLPATQPEKGGHEQQIHYTCSTNISSVTLFANPTQPRVGSGRIEWYTSRAPGHDSDCARLMPMPLPLPY